MDKTIHIKHRLNQEKKFFERVSVDNPLNSILTVELNTTELCIRTCVFCPRHDPKVYPNRNLNMSVEDAETIAINLSNHDYKGKISYSGYSENFLNKKFLEIISVMRKYLKENLFECNTNGDFLNPIPVGNLVYTITDMTQNFPPLNIAGYSYNPDSEENVLGSFSKYNLEPRQQIFFDTQMGGDTASVFIKTIYPQNIEIENQIKIIFE